MPPHGFPPLFAVVTSAALVLAIGLAPSRAEPVEPAAGSPLWPGAAPVDAITAPPPSPTHPAGDPYAAFVTEASRRFGVPESWIRAVMRTESAGDPHATSPKGAMGLMQVMPQTWAELSARYGFGPDAYDPRENILAGTAYLREMHDRYGTVDGMLAAYNAGPGRYDDHLATGRPLPVETRTYVATIAPAIGGGVPPRFSDARAVRVADVLAAPIFVARAGDRDTVAVQPASAQAAGLTLDEQRFLAWQDAHPAQAQNARRRGDRAATTHPVQDEPGTPNPLFVQVQSRGGPHDRRP
jgi:hypothetical protein